jgi:16S rRNA (guanine1207-N2)-methyltransferase
MSQFLPLLEAAIQRVQPPVTLVLGAPRLVAQLAARIDQPETVCYQMDLFQAERLREELAAGNIKAEVRAEPDLWDLPAEFQTVLFPSPPRAERELKIDMVDQAFHILKPGGVFLALSPIHGDQFFPKLVKKIYGKTSVAPVGAEGTVVWAHREGERPRRRHEMTVQARVDEGESLRFLTRPGVFTYGQLDAGTRALLAAAEINPGDRILDLGCGAGAAGLAAARRASPDGHITFVDSNLRAIALAEINAKSNGLAHYRTVAAARLEGLDENSFDVILTNPPYYATQSIAQFFVERSKALLKPGGRLYLVTKQFESIEPFVRDAFGEPELYESRGYIILVATKPAITS